MLGYAAVLALASEGIYLLSGALDPETPIHFEVILPAVLLGCMMKKPEHGLDELDALEGAQPGPDSEREQRVAGIISGSFMLLVSLSMPSIVGSALPAAGTGEARVSNDAGFPGRGMLAVHVLAVTALANLGKMFPALCYRKKASLRERLALSVALFPRGEVGAGVLVISLAYGISGAVTTVALLSLALNLLLTGVFIVAVKRLLATDRPERPEREAARRPENGPTLTDHLSLSLCERDSGSDEHGHALTCRSSPIGERTPTESTPGELPSAPGSCGRCCTRTSTQRQWRPSSATKQAELVDQGLTPPRRAMDSTTAFEGFGEFKTCSLSSTSGHAPSCASSWSAPLLRRSPVATPMRKPSTRRTPSETWR